MSTNFRYIRNIDDLRYEKHQLSKKMKKRTKRLGARWDDLYDSTTPVNVFSEFLEKYNINNAVFLSLLPAIIKYRTEIVNHPLFEKLKEKVGSKSKITTIVGGLAGLVGFIFARNAFKKKD